MTNANRILIKPAAVMAVAISGLVLAPASAIADQNASDAKVRQDTSDRTPTETNKKPLNQVRAHKGATSDRTPGDEANATGLSDTSDRTPAENNKAPLSQVDKLKDETSDRTPDDKS